MNKDEIDHRAERVRHYLREASFFEAEADTVELLKRQAMDPNLTIGGHALILRMLGAVSVSEKLTARGARIRIGDGEGIHVGTGPTTTDALVDLIRNVAAWKRKRAEDMRAVAKSYEPENEP